MKFTASDFESFTSNAALAYDVAVYVNTLIAKASIDVWAVKVADSDAPEGYRWRASSLPAAHNWHGAVKGKLILGDK
jgi:hypothetical protein